MYTVNQPGDSKNFDEKTVDELIKKIFNPVENILSFYELYKNTDAKSHSKSKRILDRWILSSLNQLIKNGAEHLDNFRIFEAGRLVRDFVGDFSTWYVRRSRERFKSDDLADKQDALSTTRFVLIEFSKYIAPFMPFFADSLYLKLRGGDDPESVHLCDWPAGGEIDKDNLELMEETRRIVSLVLERRMSAGIKVRQPLSKLEIRNPKLETKKEYLELIKDEVNVKEVVFDQNLKEEVELDTEITPELQKEGHVREFVRAVQELRKEKNLSPSDKIDLLVETDETGKEFLNSVQMEIKKPTNITNLVFNGNNGEEIKIGESIFKISLS
jgi:isoleucyl-tRNA synthetase